jgi:hypothetical protein
MVPSELDPLEERDELGIVRSALVDGLVRNDVDLLAIRYRTLWQMHRLPTKAEGSRRSWVYGNGVTSRPGRS